MTAFKVMTWNVENLFRPPADAADAEKQRFQQKLGLLAGVINQLDPDVLALQEVGGEPPLFDLRQALGGSYPHHAVSAFHDQRGIRVAFLSKFSIQDQEDTVDFPSGPALDIKELDGFGGVRPVTRMGRGALRIRVAKEGLTVDLITAHLKSKLLSFPRPGSSSFTPRDEDERAQVAGIALMRRTAEAVTLRIWANVLLAGNDRKPLLLMGDFNDVPEAQTSLILCGPPGSEIGTLGFNRPDQGDAKRLFNLAPAIDPARRFSRVENGRRELLDQIFGSEELFPVGPNNRRRLPLVDSHIDFESQLPSVGENPGEGRGGCTGSCTGDGGFLLIYQIIGLFGRQVAQRKGAGQGMAEPLDPKELVSFKELLMANSIQIDAAVQLLIEKGFFTEAEYFAKLKKVQGQYAKGHRST